MKTKNLLIPLLLFMWSMSMGAQTAGITKTERTDEKTGFKWTEVKDGDLLGVEVNGKMIVPCEYNWVELSDGYFKAGKFNPIGSALYQKDGKCIVPVSRGYTSIWISDLNGIKTIEVNKRNSWGCLDLQGKELVSTEMGYEQVMLEKDKGKLYAHVKKNNIWGVYDVTASKEIIPISRGYERVTLHDDSGMGSYFAFTKGGKDGACDINGKEFIPPKYEGLFLSTVDGFNYKENGKYIPLGIDGHGNRITTASSSSASSPSSSSYSSSSSSTYSSPSSSSSSSTSPSSTSQYGNLLYQGTYTVTGVARSSTSLSGCGDASLVQLTVYERALFRGSQEWPYAGMVTVYGETGRRYGRDRVFYLVNNAGLIWFVAQTDTDVIAMYFDKGDTRSVYTGKVFCNPIGNGGNTFNVGTFNNQQQPQNTQKLRSCTVCYGRGVCSICNGSKWVTNSFGHKGWVKCGACGGTGLCKSCNGTGRRAYW